MVSVTLIEASDHILGSFDRRLVDYVGRVFQERHVRVLTDTSVEKVEPNVAWLKDGTPLHFGLCVWSTGVKATPLVQALPPSLSKGPGGRLLVDGRLRLQGHDQKGVFAVGDCAISETRPLPCLAQVAQQQAKYLGGVLNKYSEPHVNKEVPPFEYRHLGSMAQLGMWKGVVDSAKLDDKKGDEDGKKSVLTGWTAFLLWRAAYWTKSVSWANKILIPMYWLKSWIFGRDISRF
ncbi:Pyridine nucleotide-disulfide oxidoreductase, NAD-binding domain protein [Nannochloropsis gaditana]|uniref:NADH:ubiquinone reductase (non-electrogenic) n=1 Tax=Nannochloropsis gaditana TaxID=72520 RepID=W7TS83_9STRA|nr:Pyridine nucleotide-disulfide oxidoreductase, NAD-binding domain protein [Nannochloropsis gaditana]